MSKLIYTLEITVDDPLDVLTDQEALDIVDNQMVPLLAVKGGTASRSAPIVVVEHEVKMVEQELFVDQRKIDIPDPGKTGKVQIAEAGPKQVSAGDQIKTTPARKKSTTRKKA